MAHLRKCAYYRCRMGYFLGANEFVHILTVEHDMLFTVNLYKRHRCIGQHRSDRLSISGVDSVPNGFQAERAVHCARINVCEMHYLGYPLCNGALACAGRAVNGNIDDGHYSFLLFISNYRDLPAMLRKPLYPPLRPLTMQPANYSLPCMRQRR